MKDRRPEQFSDTVVEESASLDRSLLEYHLETLTSRSQELLFENFARKLAQKTICPNLMPHTGPSGGGDSKVDSETFPVAEDLAHAWFVGVESGASDERWAFAFSAKKDWKPKVSSDVEKIAATNRGYKKAFFISNQYIPDRVRAAVEDALTKDYKLDVRVLDRSWILDRVFEGGHEDLAIEELAIEVANRKIVQAGPLDTERRKELDALEKRIADAAEQGRFDSVYVSDCLEAAITAREIELPQPDVEGRFARVNKVANKWGTAHQKLQAVYQRAWTMYFWFEEFDEIPELYLKCESLVSGSNSAHDLELLSNLWHLLHTLKREDDPLVTSTWLAERTDMLLAEADRLSSDQARPSNALQARSIGLLVKLVWSRGDRAPILRELREVVENCEGLVGFPARSLFDIVIELGTLLGDSPDYDCLFESTVKMTSAREGELVTAEMLLRRGSQQLTSGRPVDTIRVIGRALRMLYKHESRGQLVAALLLIGIAYQDIGLLWAARGSVLTAASVSSAEVHKYGNVSARLADCAHRLKWIELEVGRIAQSWDWHQLEFVVRDIVARQENELPEPHDINYDAVMGIMMLRLSITDLCVMTRMIDVLEDLRLPAAAVALRYALGYEDGLPLEEMGLGSKPVEGFLKWRDQPASRQLPYPPEIGEATRQVLRSTVIGCHIEVDVANEASCIALAETVLASLESLLSTSMAATVAPLGPRLQLEFLADDQTEVEVGFTFVREDENGLPNYSIRCSKFDPHHIAPAHQSRLQDDIYGLLIDILAHAFIIGNVEVHVTKLFRDESALERALNFTQTFIHVGNVLGHNPKLKASDWRQDEAEEHPLIRTKRWDAEVPATEESEPPREPIRTGTGPVPPELVDEANMTHANFKTTSVIRLPLWDQAKWFAVGFSMNPWEPSPPRLALIFRNREAGVRIFKVWKEEFGDKVSDQLRLSIVKGIEKKKPQYYRVAIGANPEIALRDSKFYMLFLRMCTMTPESSRNLDQFLAVYEHFKCFYLVPGYLAEGSPTPDFVDEHEIFMSSLAVRQAWEIGPHDFDFPALDDDDDPIVPESVSDPPFREALKFRQERRRS